MTKPVLSTVTRLQGNNSALISGDIVPDGFTLQFEDVPVLVQGFRRMVRKLEFDVCEMALTTYLCAREHGVRFTALPIFLVRGFHHGAILQHADHELDDLRQLEGRRVGVNRGYTVTTGVWARSILEDEFAVNLNKVCWVCSGDEHVEAWQPPPNVEALPASDTIEDLLASGELAAAVNIKSDNPDIRPVIRDPDEAGMAALRTRGHYPINHLVVVRDDVLESHPHLAVALFEAFAAAKHAYIRRLQNGEIAEPDDNDRLYRQILDQGYEPLPYGIGPNRRVLDELIAHATAQKILARPVSVEALFAPSTIRLTG